MAQAQILYRSLGPNYDPLWGSGTQNFLADLPALAQALVTKLNLLEGEWWSDLLDGTPMFQSILGKSSANVPQMTVLITNRILSLAPLVTGIANLAVTYENGVLGFNAIVETVFGQVTIFNNYPKPPAQSLGS